jgi:hypothetical protein
MRNGKMHYKSFFAKMHIILKVILPKCFYLSFRVLTRHSTNRMVLSFTNCVYLFNIVAWNSNYNKLKESV